MTTQTKVNLSVEFSEKAKTRLGRLAKLLRADAKRKNGIKFDMNVFCKLQKDNEESGEEVKHIEMDCGTQACALGLAAISGEFKREGLTMTYTHPIDPFYEGGTSQFFFKGREVEDFEAGELTFDIPLAVSEWLFGGGASKKTKGAAAEIEMAEVIEKAIKGDIPEDIARDILDRM